MVLLFLYITLYSILNIKNYINSTFIKIICFLITDFKTLGDIHKAYFGAGIDVMRLKRVKLQLEIMDLNRKLCLSPEEMTTIARGSGLNPGKSMRSNFEHNSFLCLFHQH